LDERANPAIFDCNKLGLAQIGILAYIIAVIGSDSRSYLMPVREIFPKIVSLTAISLIVGSGCTMLHEAGVPGLSGYVKKDEAAIARERFQREKFTQDRDHEALFWLLSNRLDNGMELSHVEDVLGGPGELSTDQKFLKSEGIHRTTDSAFKWGPDNKGRSVILFFREGRLSNFDPKDYRSSKE
jgi:hypothetical protein